ncbi:MAG: hypothetical protein CALGDGBN_02433 [Pseudomonadales bacterium]|nr:hypothetical protein [Pseudomonadales bacterium]
MNDGRPSPSVVVVQHVAFEDLGGFAPVLAARGIEPRLLQAGVDALREPVLGADLAVVLGGPIGVYENDRYPFLDAEIDALRERLQRGGATLGICLGAQLIAHALGGRVYPGGTREIGWSTLDLSAAGERSCLAALAGQPVLHWHGDTFDLPPGATGLASSALYPNQAFAVGERVLALQFHAEADARRIEQWLIGHCCELAHAGVDLAALRAASSTHGAGLRAAGARLFARWLDGLGL